MGPTATPLPLTGGFPGDVTQQVIQVSVLLGLTMLTIITRRRTLWGLRFLQEETAMRLPEGWSPDAPAQAQTRGDTDDVTESHRGHLHSDNQQMHHFSLITRLQILPVCSTVFFPTQSRSP